MKKLILLAMVGILLVGCGEDKISKEWMSGDWACDVEEENRNIVDGLYSKKPISTEYIAREVIDGVLYNVFPGGTKHIMNDKLLNGPVEVIVNKDDLVLKGITSIKKESDKVFIEAVDIDVYKDGNVLFEKIKRKSTCIRVY